jgi:hypothetical protein
MRLRIKVEAYDITSATGYKTGIVATGDDLLGNGKPHDGTCINNFIANSYLSKPAADSRDPLIATDQSSMFNRITYSDVDTAKTALLSDAVNTATTTYVDGTPTYSLTDGNLIIECDFVNQNNLDSWSAVVCDIGVWKIQGAVTSHWVY